MESNPMHSQMVNRLSWLATALLLCLLTAHPALAQLANGGGINEVGAVGFELEGSWRQLGTQDVSTDPVPVDFMGLPLNDEARTQALYYNESTIQMLERQCEMWSQPYMLQGPFGLKIWSDFDPLKGNIISYTIGAWEDKLPLVIWMDGRPEPSKYAERTRTGFTRGHWEGTTLVTVTTHMKEAMLRKNGVPLSDEAKMTVRFYRHGDILLMTAVIEDPLYLTAPVVWSRNFQVSIQQASTAAPPCIFTNEGQAGGASDEAPHWLWGQKPPEFMHELEKKYGIPEEVVMGYEETLYPEYRQKMKEMKASGSR